MEVIALVGASGTGKSHRALKLAHDKNIELIIDDGLLISHNRIVGGTSAKRQPTRIAAIRTSLFTDDQHAMEAREQIVRLAPRRVLVLGTSLEMVQRICNRLGLPPPGEIIRIEDIATPEEIKRALYNRRRFARHVIPAPAVEVRRSLPGTLINPFKVRLHRSPAARQHTWLEQSIVRPAFTFLGRITIAQSALIAIAAHAARQIKGVAHPGRIHIEQSHQGLTVELQPRLYCNRPLPEVAREIQQQVKNVLEEMTNLPVSCVNVIISDIILK